MFMNNKYLIIIINQIFINNKLNFKKKKIANKK